MVLRHIESLSKYVDGLQDNRAELGALYRDMLINVTSFFREPETFEALAREVFPQLLVDRPPEAPLRVWVPACSTGEEAYSIAVCALEFLRESKSAVGLQIFATDISDPALEKARAGNTPRARSARLARNGWNGFSPGPTAATRSISRFAIYAFSPGRTLSTTPLFPGWT